MSGAIPSSEESSAGARADGASGAAASGAAASGSAPSAAASSRPRLPPSSSSESRRTARRLVPRRLGEPEPERDRDLRNTYKLTFTQSIYEYAYFWKHLLNRLRMTSLWWKQTNRTRHNPCCVVAVLLASAQTDQILLRLLFGRCSSKWKKCVTNSVYLYTTVKGTTILCYMGCTSWRGLEARNSYFSRFFNIVKV